jgi:uncharacterized protein
MTQISRLFASFLLVLGLSSAIAAAQDAAGGDKIVIQVNDDAPKGLNLALNNVQNLIAYYKEKGEKLQIEVVTYGPGLHMLREDTSPVKDRVASISLASPEVQFTACGNTLAGMTKQEGTKPPLVAEAKLHPSGVARIVELQKAGYIYIKP